MTEEIAYVIVGIILFFISYYCVFRPLFALGDIPKKLENISEELRKIREGKNNGSK